MCGYFLHGVTNVFLGTVQVLIIFDDYRGGAAAGGGRWQEGEGHAVRGSPSLGGRGPAPHQPQDLLFQTVSPFVDLYMCFCH